MPRLLNEAGDNTIGSGDKSQVFRGMAGVMHVYLGGDPDASTLTLKAGFSKGGPFAPYTVNNVSGTPTVQEFAAAQLGGGLYHHAYLEHCSENIFFQFEDDGGGGPGTGWIIVVGGDISVVEEE